MNCKKNNINNKINNKKNYNESILKMMNFDL